jgi:hypothetical protein
MATVAMSNTVDVKPGTSAVAGGRCHREMAPDGPPCIPASNRLHVENLGLRMPLPARLYWQMALIWQTERLLIPGEISTLIGALTIAPGRHLLGR